MQLEKYDTALLMAIKNHKIKLKYKYDKDYEFNNKFLNNYKELAIVYADSRAIPLETVRIEYITQAMIEIFDILKPNQTKDMLINLVKKSYLNKDFQELIFEELYGSLQVIRMLNDHGKEIYDLDYSLVEEKKV